jgi:hypothetical protein
MKDKYCTHKGVSHAVFRIAGEQNPGKGEGVFLILNLRGAKSTPGGVVEMHLLFIAPQREYNDGGGRREGECFEFCIVLGGNLAGNGLVQLSKKANKQ